MLPELQQATVELAHAIAAKLVHDCVFTDQFPIENLVREMVERLNTDQSVVVKLHPADFSVWQQHVATQPAASQFGEHIRVQADNTLARGDCQATAGEISIIYELRRQMRKCENNSCRRSCHLSDSDQHDRLEPRTLEAERLMPHDGFRVQSRLRIAEDGLHTRCQRRWEINAESWNRMAAKFRPKLWALRGGWHVSRLLNSRKNYVRECRSCDRQNAEPCRSVRD